MLSRLPLYGLTIAFAMVGFIVSSVTWSQNAFATAKQYSIDMGGQGPYRPFPEDWALLPDYCRPRIGQEHEKKKYKALGKKWGKVLTTPGARNMTEAGWTNTHHYCAGLTALARIQRGVGKRSALLAEAQDQFEYMVNSSHSSYVLMPEIRWRLGQVKRDRGDANGAIKEFLESIRLKPDYSAPYIDLASIYLSKNDPHSALDIIEFGIERTQRSPVLVKMAEKIRRQAKK